MVAHGGRAAAESCNWQQALVSVGAHVKIAQLGARWFIYGCYSHYSSDQTKKMKQSARGGASQDVLQASAHDGRWHQVQQPIWPNTQHTHSGILSQGWKISNLSPDQGGDLAPMLTLYRRWPFPRRPAFR
jgi:hypothetical protein